MSDIGNSDGESVHNECNEKILNLRNVIKKQKKELQELQELKEEADEEITDLKENILKNKNISKNKIKQKKEEIEELQRKLEQAKCKISNDNPRIQELEGELECSKEENYKLKKELENLIKINEEFKVTIKDRDDEIQNIGNITKQLENEISQLKQIIKEKEENIFNNKNFEEEITKQKENFEKELHKKEEELTKKQKALDMMKLQIKNLNIEENQNSPMKFQIEGEHQTIELHIKNNDCMVDVKKRICDKLENRIDFKSLKLKLNGEILDDNQYLLPAVGSRGATVNLVLDEVTSRDFLVVKQRGNTNIPHLLQLKKNETVAGMKKTFTKYFSSETFKIFKESKEMADSKTIADYVTMDEDLIQVIKCVSGTVVLNSMFDESETLQIKYSNIDKVSSIVETISQKLKIDSQDIILFNNLQNLIADKCIFEYNIKVNSKILFYYPIKLDDIDMTGDSAIDSGFTSDLYRGFDDAKKKEIMIKYYKDSIRRFLDREYFIEELINCQKLNSHHMFVRVLGIHKSEGLLNVVMENVLEGTLNMVLKRVKKFSESDVQVFLKQIMEALRYLHDKGIPYGSLNPFNIFVDKGNHIKLSSFTLSKYFHRNDLNKELQIQFKNTSLSVSYVAPEMKLKKLTDKPVDIWCLGILLIDLVNDGMPMVTINEATSKVSYKLKYKVSDQLKEFIKACLKYDPNQRPTVDQLMKYKFYKKAE